MSNLDSRQTPADTFTRDTLEELERRMEAADARAAADCPTVMPPCPSWCLVGDGHAYDSYDETGGKFTHYRFHTSELRERLAWVAQLEGNTDGVVTLDAAHVELDYDLGSRRRELDVAQTRNLAADVTAAADLLERITAV